MRKILVIGEKTSQVKKFAEAVCGSFTSKKQAKFIYTYTGNRKTSHGEVFVFTFLPLAGHITTIETRKGFGWGECDPLDLVENKNALHLVNKRPYVSILKKNAEGMDEIWFATDPDSEGDNIAYEALQILSPLVKKHNLPIRRIWNSSLTKKEILRSFDHPLQWEDNLALAVMGRRYTDAWLGFAGTREVTMAARKVAKVKVISLGRVQLPTLHMVVERDFEHEQFKSKKKWNIEALTEYGRLKLTHEKQPFSKKEDANAIFQKVKDEKNGMIKNINVQQKSEKPPVPLNTTAAIALLSRLLKKPSSVCLSYLEELYEKELISYPRTENTKFSDNFPHTEILDKLDVFPPLHALISKITEKKQVRRNGKKMETEDHDPIHPTGEMKMLATLSPNVYRTWEIITRHYIAMFMHDFISENVLLQVTISDEPFVGRLKKTVQLGWKESANWHSVRSDEIELSGLNKLGIKKISLLETKTQPPKRISDSMLLVEMEKKRIGTKSSRPEIIKKLQDRNYIVRKGTQLTSTLWGRVLILSLAPIWSEVIRPDFTAEVEEQMDKVANKEKKYGEMLESLRTRYISLHKSLKQNLITFQRLLISSGLTDQNTIEEDNEKKRMIWDLYSKVRKMQYGNRQSS